MKVDKEKALRLYQEFIELNGRKPTISESKELAMVLLAKDLQEYPKNVVDECWDLAVKDVFQGEKK